MFLFVWAPGQVRQVADNISVGDLAGVRAGILQIFRQPNHGFEKLVLDMEKVCWVPVKAAEVVQCREARFHH